MEIFRDIANTDLAMRRSVLTMGNFDGIHLGHQALLRNAVREAKSYTCPAAALTFEPHPVKVLAPDRAPGMILSHKDKMELFRSFGVDVVIVQPFDSQFAAIEAEEFVEKYLVERLQIRKIWVGRDLRFGRGRKGSVDDLLRWGDARGFAVGIVEPVLLGGVRISSSEVRQMIERGKVDGVKPLLGRYHFVSGRVVPGNRRGRELGFPTANVQARTEVIPADGIYATLFQVQEKYWPSATNIGVNPTFGGGTRTIEAFIFDFHGDLYGMFAKVHFVARIREERKFATPEELVVQMKQDTVEAKKILSGVQLSDAAGYGR